jgi:hypothetical protein
LEHILIGKGRIFKIGGGENGIMLSLSENGSIIKTVPLTKHSAQVFSADIDLNEGIHVAAVISGTLTYIRYTGEKTSTVHLMRLPDKFNITSVIINCEQGLRLNYCVKSREGCAIIEYTENNDTWKGKNIYTCEADMTVNFVKKNKNECYAVKKDNNSYMLINAYEPEKVIFSSMQPIEYVQGMFEGVISTSGDRVYRNGDEIALGARVYALDGKRVLAYNKENLREYLLEGEARFQGEMELPRGKKEYVLCVPESDKRIILSPPFPYIKVEPEIKNNGGLLQEVYMQQRTLFKLSAEIKELKARIRHLEEITKSLR